MIGERTLRAGRDMAGAATGLAAGAGRAWLHTVAWGARTGMAAGSRLTAAVDPALAARLADDVRSGLDDARSALRERAREFLGVRDAEERAASGGAAVRGRAGRARRGGG